MGTRLRPFTDEVPKAFMPVLGIPSIQFSLDMLLEANISRVGINFHHLPKVSQEYLNKLDYRGMQKYFNDESALLLGSGGGVRALAESCRSKHVLILNADTISDVCIDQLYSRHIEMEKIHNVDATVILCEGAINKEGFRELLFDKNSELVIDISSRKKGAPFFGSAMIVRKESLFSLPLNQVSDFTSDYLIPQVKKKKIALMKYEGFWADTGTPQAWAGTHFQLMERLVEKKIKNTTICKRINELNKFESKNICVLKQSSKQYKLMGEVVGPIYFSGDNIDPPGQQLGPFSIIYGHTDLICPNKAYFNGKSLSISDIMH